MGRWIVQYGPDGLASSMTWDPSIPPKKSVGESLVRGMKQLRDAARIKKDEPALTLKEAVAIASKQFELFDKVE